MRFIDLQLPHEALKLCNNNSNTCNKKLCTICPSPLQVDLLTFKVVSESRVTWATSVPILVFLGLSVLNLGPMYETDRRQTKASLNAPAY